MNKKYLLHLVGIKTHKSIMVEAYVDFDKPYGSASKDALLYNYNKNLISVMMVSPENEIRYNLYECSNNITVYDINSNNEIVENRDMELKDFMPLVYIKEFDSMDDLREALILNKSLGGK